MASFLLLNGSTTVLALVVARRLGLGGRVAQLSLATLAGYLVLVHSLMLGAGLLGMLTVGGVTALLLIVVTGVAALAGRVGVADDDAGPRACTTAATRLASLIAAVLGVAWTWPHLFAATQVWVWDDYTYHMVYPTLWLRAHAIAAASAEHAFTMQAWYPLSGSVVAAWYMLPFDGVRGDALAWVSLTAPLYAGIVAAGAAEALARVGCPAGVWAIPVVLLVTSTRIGIMASSFSDADLAQAAALFGAFVFAVPRDGDDGDRAVMVDAGYAGLLTGFALGVKVSAAIPALVVLAMIGLRSRARCWTLTRILLIFAVAWSVTAGYWYVRNLAHTDNPLYPAAFLAWPGATFPETTLREYSRVHGVGRAFRDALSVYMDWPVFHASLAVVGLLGLGVWLARAGRRMTRPQRYFACGALVIATSMVLTLPTMPYSAGNAMTLRSGFVHWDSMRYVALLPLLGWTALGATLAARVARVSGAAAESPEAERRFAAWGATPGVLTVALVVVVIVISFHHWKAAATAAAFHREPLFGGAAAVLDAAPPGRVAVFGDQWIYPAFGDRRQLTPVRVDRDGRVARSPIGDAMEPGEPTVDALTLRANLEAAGIGLVVVVRLPHPGRSSERPGQHVALASLRDTRLLYQDAGVAIWRLGPSR